MPISKGAIVMVKIVLTLKVDKVLEKEYEGKKTINVQTIEEHERRGFEVLKVKLIDDSITFKEGDIISIPVKLSSMNSQIFYTQNGKIEVVKG